MMEGSLHYLILTCDARSIHQMELLCDEITDALRIPEEGSTPAEVLVISYGLTNRRARGFLLLLVKGDIPTHFTQKLYQDTSITDFVTTGPMRGADAPKMLTHPLHVDEQGPPEVPDGYCLLTTPTSLVRPDNERWIAQAASDHPDEGMGILIYEERRQILFLSAEEAISVAACLLWVAPALLAATRDTYLHLHPSEVAVVSRVVWEVEQRRALQLLQKAGTELPPPVALKDLHAWLLRHGYRLMPHDRLPGGRVVPDETNGGEGQE